MFRVSFCYEFLLSGSQWCTSCSMRHARPRSSKTSWGRWRAESSAATVMQCTSYAAYRKFARLHPRFLLAFCWAAAAQGFLGTGQCSSADAGVGNGVGRCHCADLLAQSSSAGPSHGQPAEHRARHRTAKGLARHGRRACWCTCRLVATLATARSPLSRRLCELFAWFMPNGELKEMTCRVALSAHA